MAQWGLRRLALGPPTASARRLLSRRLRLLVLDRYCSASGGTGCGCRPRAGGAAGVNAPGSSDCVRSAAARSARGVHAARGRSPELCKGLGLVNVDAIGLGKLRDLRGPSAGARGGLSREFGAASAIGTASSQPLPAAPRCSQQDAPRRSSGRDTAAPASWPGEEVDQKSSLGVGRSAQAAGEGRANAQKARKQVGTPKIVGRPAAKARSRSASDHC